MAFFDTRDGTRLYYSDWGTGKPVVLVPAAFMNTEMWELQMTFLASRGLRCISYDRRGHGRSDWPAEGYDYDTLASDLAALIDFLDLRDITLVGYSMGSGEVIRYLSRYGSDRVSRLAILSGTAPFLQKTEDNPEGIEPSMYDQMVERRTQDRPKWFADNAPPIFRCRLARDFRIAGTDAMGRANVPAMFGKSYDRLWRSRLPNGFSSRDEGHNTADLDHPRRCRPVGARPPMRQKIVAAHPGQSVHRV